LRQDYIIFIIIFLTFFTDETCPIEKGIATRKGIRLTSELRLLDETCPIEKGIATLILSLRTTLPLVEAQG